MFVHCGLVGYIGNQQSVAQPWGRAEEAEAPQSLVKSLKIFFPNMLAFKRVLGLTSM